MSIVADGWINGVSPLDCKPLEQVAVITPEQLAKQLAQARTAQAIWAARPLKERAKILREAGRYLLAHAEDIAEVLHRELGKPLTDCYTVDLGSTPEVFDYYTAQASKLLATESVKFNRIMFPRKYGVVERVPHGVIGLITPWNYPISIPVHNLVPALLAGNAVMLKPSEYAARTGALLVELLATRLPIDLLSVVQGDGSTGEALIQSGIEAVVFVGGAQGGRAVARAAADQLIPAMLELGGKDAAIVLEDADLERAANGIAWAGLVNAGQSCAAVERIYVCETIAEAFTAKLAEVLQRLRLGDDSTAPGSVEIGPISTARQLEIIKAQVEEAIAQGACKLSGDINNLSGNYYPPTILTNATAEMRVMREETFGPVLPIQVVADEQAAVIAANATRYGLTASVWTQDLARGQRVARQLKAGVLTINNHLFTGAAPQAAWGGMAESGYGVQNGKLAIQALTRPRLIATDANLVKRELWWFPYDQPLFDLGRGLMAWKGEAHGLRGWRRKLLLTMRMSRGALIRLWKTPK